MSAHVDPVRFAAATGEDRRAMVVHLQTCAGCRAAVAADDPVAIFSLLAERPIPPRVLDDVSAHVTRRAGLDRGSIGALLASMPPIRLRLAAALLAGVALLGATTVLRRSPVDVPLAGGVRMSPPAPMQRADVDVLPAQAVSQVVDFTVGETQVVMVYNGDLEL